MSNVLYRHAAGVSDVCMTERRNCGNTSAPVLSQIGDQSPMRHFTKIAVVLRLHFTKTIDATANLDQLPLHHRIVTPDSCAADPARLLCALAYAGDIQSLDMSMNLT